MSRSGLTTAFQPATVGFGPLDADADADADADSDADVEEGAGSGFVVRAAQEYGPGHRGAHHPDRGHRDRDHPFTSIWPAVATHG
jgi:hypothetical protein